MSPSSLVQITSLSPASGTDRWHAACINHYSRGLCLLCFYSQWVHRRVLKLCSVSLSCSSEIISILQDSPANCLPLFKFTEIYEKKWVRLTDNTCTLISLKTWRLEFFGELVYKNCLKPDCIKILNGPFQLVNYFVIHFILLKNNVSAVLSVSRMIDTLV